ncbi:MAG: glycosyltransferase family 4 protein [Rickettsiales bacterium]|jgi:glycosyltransferase involved in cell wall biosynthesis|nr:glycosyltransferase family 4 protein [Rickettsiales bacterium]
MDGSKIRVLIDIDNVLAGVVDRKNKTGLHWAARNIITKLMKEKDLDITFLTSRNTTILYDDLCNLEPAFRGFRCINSIGLSVREWCAMPLTYLIVRRMKFRRQRRTSGGLKSLVSFIFYLIFTVLAKCLGVISLFAKKNAEILDEFDVYQSTFYKIPDLILQNGKIRKYILVHDIIPLRDIANYEDIHPKTRSNFAKIFENLNSNVGFFFNSQYTREDFLDYFPQYRTNRNLVTPLAADGALFYRDNSPDREKQDRILAKYKIPLDKKYVLSVGSINPRKNLLFLVECFVEFLNNHSDVDNLFLVLSGPLGWHVKELFRCLVKNEKYKSKIILTGYLDDADLNTVYNRAFCFVYPSLYEGFGLPILEAMQCGLPVIASNTTSMPEVYGDAGLAIDPRKRQDLLEAFRKICFDENLCNDLAIRSLQRSQLFSWDRTARLFLEEYKSGQKVQSSTSAK